MTTPRESPDREPRSLDPDGTLRAYGDAFRNGRWGGSWPPAPELCLERYGGGRES